MLRLLMCELAIYGAPCSCRAHSTSLIGIGISAAHIRVRDVNKPVCKKVDETSCSYEGVCGPNLIILYCIVYYTMSGIAKLQSRTNFIPQHSVIA